MPGSSGIAEIPILIVDDEPEIIAAYRSILVVAESAGSDNAGDSEFEELRARLFPDAPGKDQSVAGSQSRFLVEQANSAEEAVAKVREGFEKGSPFSVVFLDMRMRPGQDGLWAAERIRELDSLVEIIICTAYSDVNPLDIVARVQPPEKLFYIQKPFHFHEVRQMAHALGHKRLAEDEVARLAYYDALTGLPNRAHILRLIGSEMERFKLSRLGFALLYFDLDKFKRINDALGHTFGDQILEEIARRLVSVLKDIDEQALMPADFCFSSVAARLGSDEFLLMLNGIRSPEQAQALALQIQQAMAVPIMLDICEVQMTHSTGIALYPEHGDVPELLISHAAVAMQYAKREGRGIVKHYQPLMNQDVLRRFTLENLLRTALEKQELSLRYEPQINLLTGLCCGMEALLRWNCSEVGIVSPAEFIPIAEESGIIIAIGEWVMREACRQVVAWRRDGSALERICVNISSVQLCQPDFSELVERIIGDSGLPPQCLELELTESMLIENPQAAKSVLHRLRALGVRFAIDDFGTGHSSLSRLQEFDVDRLKIDRAFIVNLAAQESDADISKTIIGLGQSLGLEVIAEGIEHLAQLEILRRQNCEQVQGYLISRPLPPEEAQRFLDDCRASGSWQSFQPMHRNGSQRSAPTMPTVSIQ